MLKQFYFHTQSHGPCFMFYMSWFGVSNLRKKLGHELMEARRGHGYCIG